ncbi:MAG: PQQ-binding-like beta-propeller repeat protein, partial [Dehalococcoidales bacterium]|nr:PQQ-binding-like beta-propeller repeat protein [Dehalococcoidales bacterium]
MTLGKILLLLVILLLFGLTIGCARGGARGWSGGTIADGTLFLGSMKGKLVALNTSDGSRLWEVTLGTAKPVGGFGCASAFTPVVAIYGTPAVDGGLVYIGSYNGIIYAFSRDKGAWRWVYPRTDNLGPIVGGPVVAWGKVYFGSSDGKLYALDATTGDKEWEFQTGGKIWSTPTIDGDMLYIGSFDKKLYALRATD